MILKYKVYERLELRGIEPFNTYDNNTVRKSFFIFAERD